MRRPFLTEVLQNWPLCKGKGEGEEVVGSARLRAVTVEGKEVLVFADPGAWTSLGASKTEIDLLFP